VVLGAAVSAEHRPRGPCRCAAGSLGSSTKRGRDRLAPAARCFAADRRCGFRFSGLEAISAASPRIRLARIEEASALSELCLRSKASWGYEEAFINGHRISAVGLIGEISSSFRRSRR